MRVREKLKTFKDYDDFLRNFENHREKHETRSTLLREEGWKDLQDKTKVDDIAFYHKNSEKYKYKYNAYKSVETFYEGYWDTKANHIYYSQSTPIRAWLQFKKVSNFY